MGQRRVSGGWQMETQPPSVAGLYERDCGAGEVDPLIDLDYWNGECWKFAYDGQPTNFTAVPNKRWREPKRENLQ